MKPYTLLTIGKVKESFCANGIREFAKRIKNLEIVSVKDSTKEKEGVAIMDYITKNKFDCIIAMDEHGKQLSSIDFAHLLKDKQSEKICFIIGGPDGIAAEVRAKANHTIGLSKMTFTHDMAQLFFVEQLYRAESILAGKKYHRE